MNTSKPLRIGVDAAIWGSRVSNCVCKKFPNFFNDAILSPLRNPRPDIGPPARGQKSGKPT
jgi:hypothetical protein